MDDKYNLLLKTLGLLTAIGVLSLLVQFIPSAVCSDGWLSASIGKAGACSSHGGIKDNSSLYMFAVIVAAITGIGLFGSLTTSNSLLMVFAKLVQLASLVAFFIALSMLANTTGVKGFWGLVASFAILFSVFAVGQLLEKLQDYVDRRRMELCNHDWRDVNNPYYSKACNKCQALGGLKHRARSTLEKNQED
ncbi:hypothetical protein [uncultured Pseudoteredinibacter sp.]|uniref:hypothetical protein n=1 Tax=uncultured Pseudoteredinibacter sp. TaxID=1641701 RepID=UPI002604EC4B|nr:hypothetical protein [uncultured Pseudoteredinibacter sp.]